MLAISITTYTMYDAESSVSNFTRYIQSRAQCMHVRQAAKTVGRDKNKLLHFYARAKELVQGIEHMQQLIELGASLEVRNAQYWTPLHVAAHAGNKDAVTLLLNHGADVHACDKQDNTPLHSAFLGGDYPEIIDVLLKAGADAQAQNLQGDTPLHIAAYSARSSALSVLLNHGVSVALLNSNYDTPLHSAATQCISHIDILVKLLSAPDACPESKNKQGKTFCTIMKEQQAHALAQALKKSK